MTNILRVAMKWAAWPNLAIGRRPTVSGSITFRGFEPILRIESRFEGIPFASFPPKKYTPS